MSRTSTRKPPAHSRSLGRALLIGLLPLTGPILGQDSFFKQPQATPFERSHLEAEAKTAAHEANRLSRDGKLEEAVDAGDRARRAMRGLGRDLHPNFVALSRAIADWQEQTGKFDEAQKTRREVLYIEER